MTVLCGLRTKIFPNSFPGPRFESLDALAREGRAKKESPYFIVKVAAFEIFPQHFAHDSYFLVRGLYHCRSYLLTNNMVSKTTIGPKGQLTIPKEMRERYHMQEGEQVLLIPVDEGVIIKHSSSNLRGRLRGKIDLGQFEKDLQELRSQWKL